MSPRGAMGGGPGGRTVPVVLAIEASQRVGGVAVRDPSGVTHVEPFTGGLQHDDDLLPAIDRLYARVGLKPTDTAAVGVSVGPGGFTGLRIAVATAKMLAEAIDAKVIAVPSALVVAGSHDGPGPILVTLASKEDTCWVARLQRADEGWTIEGEPSVCDADALPLPGVVTLLGDRYLPDAARSACARAGVAVEAPVFDAAVCLAIACTRADDGCYDDPLTLEPIYARPPSAVTMWEQRSS